ncbi:MAG: VWA-like domain-containing protein [Granulosicoccus sp.]
MSDNLSHLADAKLVVARTSLILDKPFLGALVLGLELKCTLDSWCKTIATDARFIYYNPEYIEALRPAEVQFVLSHEALHCALLHFSRRQHRVSHRWDLACDYAINPILLDEGMTPPPGVHVLEEYRGMSAEEIYPCLSDNDHSETLDQHLFDKQNDSREGEIGAEHESMDDSQTGQCSGDSHTGQSQKKASASGSTVMPQEAGSGKHGATSQLTDGENQTETQMLNDKWQQRLAGATRQATVAGKMSSLMQRFIRQQTRPDLSWRVLLAQYLVASGKDDYSWSRPSSRRGHPAIFPALRSAEVNLIVAIDVSGSVSDEDIGACVAEVNSIKAQMRARITLIACDAGIVDGFPREFYAWDDFRFDGEIAGGGSTDFRPVFEWAVQQDIQADVLLYFTDGHGTFPKAPPIFPVVWLVKGKAPVPWGKRIQLN